MILDKSFAKLFKKVDRGFSIEYIGCAFERCFDESFEFMGENHDFVELVYVMSGSVEIVEDEKVYLLESGDIIFHAPMEFHRIKSDKGSSPKVYNLSFEASGKLPENIYNGVFHVGAELGAEILRVFGLASRFLSGDDMSGSGGEASDALSSLIWRILRRNDQVDNLINDRSAMLYRGLVDSMHRGLCDNLTLEDIARQNHMSVSYLKTVFRQYANTSPKEYYKNLRVAEAARRILAGESAAQIASDMNFSSAAYFTSFFKKNMGCCPSEYKKQG